MILFWSLPTAITLGLFQAEEIGGQLDILTTVSVSVKRKHSFYAWWVASMGWNVANLLCTYAFFCGVLTYSEAWIPAVVLFLMACTLGNIYDATFVAMM